MIILQPFFNFQDQKTTINFRFSKFLSHVIFLKQTQNQESYYFGSYYEEETGKVTILVLMMKKKIELSRVKNKQSQRNQ